MSAKGRARGAPQGAARALAMCISCAVLAAAALAPVVRQSPSAPAVGTAPAAVPAHKVDVNSAGEAELALLPGIGPSTAGRIVRDRAQRGAFGSIDDLGRVKGIGPATLERIRPFAVAGRAA